MPPLSRPEVKVKLQAFAVAMAAKAGAVEALDVDTLEEMAAQILAEDAPLARAIFAFATRFPLVLADRAALAAEGDTLARAVELANLPEAPDAGRVDIHG